MITRFEPVSLVMSLFLPAIAPASGIGDGAHGPNETRLPPVVVSVPMESWGGRPIVSATINDRGPFRLLIDTGTELEAVLDDDVFRRSGVAVSGDAPALGDALDDETVNLHTIRIGGAEFHNVPGRRASFADMGGTGRDAPSGILGLPLFKECLLTLDYPAKEVRFETGALDEAAEGVLSYSADRERDFGVTIRIAVAGIPVNAHVDTGSPGFVTLLNKMQEKLPLQGRPRVVGMARTPMGDARVSAAKLDGFVVIGPYEFEKPSIDFADLGPMVSHDCGNVGYRLLKDFAITVDQKNRRLRLVRGGSAGE